VQNMSDPMKYCWRSKSDRIHCKIVV